MFNAQRPAETELPTAAQLLRSTVIALGAAAAILVTVVMPAEFGIDPTGAGRALGLTEMGEIKGQLAEEAAADDHSGFAQEQTSVFAALSSAFIGAAHAHGNHGEWDDHVERVLNPGESLEIKLTMREGDEIEFTWVAEGGRLNYDLHGHGGKNEISYIKGRGVPTHDGFLIAAFNGNHGWFWRNRDRKPVTLKLYVRGQYTEIVQE